MKCPLQFLVAIFNMFLIKAKREGTNNIGSEKKI